jgi:hypothetical protein
MIASTLRGAVGLLALLRHPFSPRGLTPDERANLAVSVAIPAVFTASLGGHARLLTDRTAPPDRVN